MAKTSIGLGQFSGRVGGVVYAVRSGQQVVRSYQPVVANPKSYAQNLQRAKGNLIGRISQIVPWQILEGLGSSRINRRARLLRLLFQKVTSGSAAGDTETINAKLLDEDFVFSEGALVPFYYLTAITATASGVSVTVNRDNAISAETAASQGVLVVVVLKQASGAWEQVLYRYVTPSEIASGSFTFTLNHRYEGAYNAAVYYAPFSTADGSRLNTVSGELTSTATSLDALLSVGTSATALVWGKNLYQTTANFSPSTSA